VQKVTTLPDFPPTNLRTKFPAGVVSDVGLALFRKFLMYDPKRRITCEEALKDDYFKVGAGLS
jgi:cell division cycle 2-like protein